MIIFFLKGAIIETTRKRTLMDYNLPIAGPSTLKLMLSGSMSVIPCRARYHCTSLFDLLNIIFHCQTKSDKQKAESPKLVSLGTVDIDVIFTSRLASRPHHHLVRICGKIGNKREAICLSPLYYD